MEGQRAAAPARQKRIEALLAKEGEAGLDKSIARMRSNLEKEGSDKELISSLLKDYEAKKAELEAARGGGGNVTNIAQNNSRHNRSETTRHENLVIMESKSVVEENDY